MSWLSKKMRSKNFASRAVETTRAFLGAGRSHHVCFFIPEASRGWILEAAMLEIASRYDGIYSVCTDFEQLPKAADSFYFVHYHFYLHALAMHSWLADKNNVVWFTHPKDKDLGGEAARENLRNAVVVTMCSKWRSYLLQQGLHANRVETIIGGADPNMFRPHQRRGGKVGFCTAFYDRKHPERILELVKELPGLEFVLLGRNWEQYSRFGELVALENFEYRVADYSEYPAFYGELDVFVSVSELEGGPIPLLEAMMANVVPVASDTGFAPDLIQHGVNGYTFSASSATMQDVAVLVELAISNRANIRNSVLQYDWDNYASRHHELLRAS
ncbi:MAG: hypothetical protein Aurels2KO_21200 [Aureliella sp.]